MANSTSNNPPKRLLSALPFCIGCLAIGALGGLATASSVKSWFPTLVKPALNPPSAVFGPVWTTLYLLIGISAWLVWCKGGLRLKSKATFWFSAQLILNLVWSLLFFGLKRPDLALIDILLLWLAIANTARLFGKVSKLASWLLIPYLLWVSFATYLNAGIYWLNR